MRTGGVWFDPSKPARATSAVGESSVAVQGPALSRREQHGARAAPEQPMPEARRTEKLAELRSSNSPNSDDAGEPLLPRIGLVEEEEEDRG
jgi:hypothetical protein